MRFVSSRWRHSLAAQLLGTYVAALILTTSFFACVMWFDFSRDVDVVTQRQLRKAADMIHRSLRFDSAGLPVSVVFLPSDLSRAFHDFASELKYRVLDVSGAVIISSDDGSTALTPAGQPFDSTLGSFTLVSGGEPLLVTTEPMAHGAKTYYIQVAISGRLMAFVRSLTAHFVVTDTLRFALASVVLFTVAVYFRCARPLPQRHVSMRATYRSACRRTIFRSNSFRLSMRSISRSTGSRRDTKYSGLSLRARPMN